MTKRTLAEKSDSLSITTTIDAKRHMRDLHQCKCQIEILAGELRKAQTAHARAEEMLRAKTEELTYANQELDAFIGSVTHGMRNSLQTITGFSQTLLKFYFDTLDETGRDCLSRIGAGTKKLKSIIDSLVDLSRISSQEMTREKVDLSEIARNICSSLKASEPHRIVECVIMPDLCADADRGLARILLENLIGNAWKFTSKTDKAVIEFGVMHEKKAPEFFVRDNGVGFDPSHRDKLFKPLQHLHKEEALKGMGIGLTVVKRIMHKHGGTVRAEAEMGKGATFIFQFSRA
jgi:light-regulated signal transduction histidine kinase (bacteriophytochrome)